MGSATFAGTLERHYRETKKKIIDEVRERPRAVKKEGKK